MIKSIGQEELGEHDDANIPCNIFITAIDENDIEEVDENWGGDEESDGPAPSSWAKWKLHADNFMPRKGLADGVYTYVASTKEELMELVKEKVLPSYIIAVKAVTELSEGKRDSFHYWTEKDD